MRSRRNQGRGRRFDCVRSGARAMSRRPPTQVRAAPVSAGSPCRVTPNAVTADRLLLPWTSVASTMSDSWRESGLPANRASVRRGRQADACRVRAASGRAGRPGRFPERRRLLRVQSLSQMKATLRAHLAAARPAAVRTVVSAPLAAARRRPRRRARASAPPMTPFRTPRPVDRHERLTLHPTHPDAFTDQAGNGGLMSSRGAYRVCVTNPSRDAAL